MRIFSKIKKQILIGIVIILQKSSNLSAVACRLTQLTRKHPDKIHPKHLINKKPWFIKHLKKPDIVLDIGCGNGQRVLPAAKFVKQVIGLDNNIKSLKLAKAEVKRLHITNVKFVKFNLEQKLLFNNQQFDCILLLDVLEHLNHRLQLLKQIYRVLKPSGLLFLSVPKSDTSWKLLQKSLGLNYYSDADHKIEFTQKEIIDLLTKSGFKINQILPATFDTPWVGFIDLVGGFSLKYYRILSQWRRNQALINPCESIGFEIICQKKSQL